MSSKIDFAFVTPDGKEILVTGELGETLLAVAHKNNVPLEGACGGSLACSTCHVIMDEETYVEVNKIRCMSEQEEDLLDCVGTDLTKTSRLGCQVLVDLLLKGKKIRIASACRCH